ncbi:MAG: protein kinase [Clostridia bacterium]|nr:protein kinase [Clostridia bacterium]
MMEEKILNFEKIAEQIQGYKSIETLKNDSPKDQYGECVEKVLTDKNELCVRRILYAYNASCEDLLNLDSDFLNKTLAVGFKDGRTYILEKYMDNDWVSLDKCDISKFGKKDVIDIIINVAEALKALHNHDLIYQDMSLSHIMYNQKDKKIKLINYTKVWKKGKKRLCINNTYLPPESLGNVNYGEPDLSSDIFSLGILAKNFIKTEILEKDRDLKGVIKKAMETSVDHRTKSCEIFIEELKYCKKNYISKHWNLLLILFIVVPTLVCLLYWVGVF